MRPMGRFLLAVLVGTTVAAPLVFVAEAYGVYDDVSPLIILIAMLAGSLVDRRRFYYGEGEPLLRRPRRQ